MNEIGVLINLIEDNINTIKTKLNNKEQDIDNQLCTFLKNEIRMVVEDNSRLLALDIDKIKEICPLLPEGDIGTLEFYKMILSANNFKMSDYDQGALRSILAKVNSFLLEYEDKYINVYKEDELLIEKYNSLLDKIRGSFDLDSADIQMIYDMLNNSDIDVEDSIKIVRYIANETINKIDVLEEEKEVNEKIEIVETNLDESDLIELFKRHNSDFMLLSKEARKEIQKYGRLDNIEEIFITLEKYRIDSINPYVKRALHLSRIFVYSNAKLMENIFETCVKYNIIKTINSAGEPILDFELLLKTPSKFIKRKREFRKRDKDINSSDILAFDNSIGSQEDFIKNVELFANEGLDVGSAYKKNVTSFDLPHQHIKTGIKNLKLYGIEKERYLHTLSCFGTRKQSDSFDQFIELGYFDYVKDNLSRAILLPDAPMFYKIARANQLGLTIPRTSRKGMPSDVTFDNKQFLGVNSMNGEIQTRRYLPEFVNKKYYDDVIEKSDNNNIVLAQEDEFIKELDQRYLSEEDNMLYVIGDVKISRLKVMRIYNTLKLNSLDGTLESLMYTITRNSILTEEQFMTIEQEISNLYNSLENTGRRI